MNRLEDRLNEYKDAGVTPMHMPGHKRNPGLVPSYYQNDITEIDGFDNLHAPEGILKELTESAASVWKAKNAFLSVNGATAPILASIMAASKEGKVLLASNCHISVWHALELSGAPFEVIDPVSDPKYPFLMSIDPSLIDGKLRSDPDIRTVIITSPTYEGVVSDVKEIFRITGKYNAVLIVDESHGSHLGLNEYFPESSVADIVIKSIHKTLHAPTQTAILLTYTDAVSSDLIKHYMDIFVSTSPSYLLMSGISRVIYDLKSKPKITDTWCDALKKVRKRLSDELLHVKLFEGEHDDPSKLVILTGGVTDGRELARRLRENRIEVEAAYSTHIIAMTGIGDDEDSLKAFAEALIRIDSTLEGSVTSGGIVMPVSPFTMCMSIKDAAQSEYDIRNKDECEGLISASYVFSYPPGIPVLIPGQKITKDRLKLAPGTSLRVVSG